MNQQNKESKQVLLHFEEDYRNAMFYADNQHQRDLKLARIMTSMENHFKIPLVGKERIENFAKNYPEVIELYKRVSSSRGI